MILQAKENGSLVNWLVICGIYMYMATISIAVIAFVIDNSATGIICNVRKNFLLHLFPQE